MSPKVESCIGCIHTVFSKIYDKSTFCVLCIGFLIGFALGFLFIQTSGKNDLIKSKINLVETSSVHNVLHPEHNKWLQSEGYRRSCLSADIVSYGNSSVTTESTFLKQHIHVLCVIFVKNGKKAKTVLYTWGKHCNKVVFFALKDTKDLNIPITVIKPLSSWHYLCTAIRHIWLEHSAGLQWILFAPDGLFALPENLRLLVSSLDPEEPHYLGHAHTMWGENYNVAQAGYVLSARAFNNIALQFNSSLACEKGGKYWKNEDFYLGKHLGAMGISPVDTRDHLGRGRFHGYNFNQLLFTRKLSPLSSYWRKSIYPVTEGRECCSDTSITFHGIEEDKVNQFYYLLYHLKSFSTGGTLGNRPAPTPIPDHEVWRHFLLDEGLIDSLDQEVSADQFFELSKRKVLEPDVFNKVIKQEATANHHEDG